MNSRRLIYFFLLSYFISWFIWFPLYAPALGIFDLPVLPYHHALGGLGPLTASFVFIYKYGNAAEFKQHLISLFNIKGKILYLLVAALAPFVILLLSISYNAVFNYGAFALNGIGVSSEFPEMNSIIFFIYNLVFFGLGEEAGWRGIALPELQKRFKPFTSTLIITCMWAGWHIPLFFYRPGYTHMDGAAMAGWLFSLLTGSFLLTWMYNRSKSVFVCAVFHSAIDIVFTSSLADKNIINIAGAVITLWGALTVVFFYRDFFGKKVETEEAN